MLKTALLLLASFIGQVDRTVDRSSTSVIMHVFIGDSSVTTGAGLTGLTNASSGLVISAIHPGDASATVYSVASSNVETISTLGTYAAPTSGKVRFKELDSTNMPGVYELHLANGLFSVSSDTTLRLTLKGATNMRVTNYVFQIGSPANMVRINGALTDGTPADASKPAIYLRTIDVRNPSGNGIDSRSTATASVFNGIYGEGSPGSSGVGGGSGIQGQGGAGYVNDDRSSGAGINGVGGYNGSTSGTQVEHGGPGIRGVGGGSDTVAGAAPGITGLAKGTGSSIRLICKDGVGLECYPTGTGKAIGLGGGTNGGVCINLGTYAGNSDVINIAPNGTGNAIFMNGADVKLGTFHGNIVGSLGNIASAPFNVTDSGANYVTLGDIAGTFPDDSLVGLQFICSNFQNAIVTDYEGATGKATIRCTQSNGNWLSNPVIGTDTIQFGNFPMELPATVGTAVGNTVVESSITPGSGLVNDSGTQLSSITLKQAIALIMSATNGKLTGSGTTTITIRPAGKPGDPARISATVSGGNRNAVNLRAPD